MIDLSLYEKKIYSQNGEDGVIEKLLSLIGIHYNFFVEFGVEDGNECNTRYIEEKFKLNGIRFDCNFYSIDRKIYKCRINKENILDIFSFYNIPKQIDVLSIDTDYNDFYLWKELLNCYTANIVIIEYNSNFKLENKIVVYDPNGKWDHTNYFGAGIIPLFNLGKQFGYDLVYADNNGVNLFFVKSNLLLDEIKNKNNCPLIFRHKIADHGGDLMNRKFVCYEHDS